MQVIDCKAIRDKILMDEIKEKLKGKIVLALLKEDNPENRSYLKSIKKTAELVGVQVDEKLLPKRTTAKDINDLMIVETVEKYNGHIPDDVLLVGFKPDEAEKIQEHSNMLQKTNLLDSPKYPDVSVAAYQIIKETLKEKMVDSICTVIIGRSQYAAKLGDKLVKDHHTVTICHRGTENIQEYLKKADVIVSFAGCPELIKSDMVKDGALIVSVGCRFKDGKLCGDIDLESMKDRNVTVTPTPNGVGIVTTAVMFKSMVE